MKNAVIWLDLIQDGACEDDWDYECLFCGGERRAFFKGSEG